MFYCLIGSLDPELAFNDGMRDVVRFVFAPRTVTNAEPPAPVSNYQMVNLKLVDVILEAMANFNPARAIANAGSSSALGIAWSKAARPIQHAIRDRRLRLWRRHGTRRRHGDGDAFEQSAHHPDRNSRSGVPVPHHAIRPRSRFRRRRAVARRRQHAARI